jgi:hypothetical protein
MGKRLESKSEIVTDGGPPVRCSICHESIPVEGMFAEGHNAWPVNNGRCCGECNSFVVIPTRIRRMREERLLAEAEAEAKRCE